MFEEPRIARHELGARIEYLRNRSNVLTKPIDDLEVLVNFAEQLNLDKTRIVSFLTYISGEIMDTETELEITKSDYEGMR